MAARLTDRRRKENWYHCPYCGKAIFPIQPDTRIEHLVLRCKACRHDMEINVFPAKVNSLRAKSL